MKTIARMALGATAALIGLMVPTVVTASAASAAPTGGGGGAYTCTGGNIAPGTYRSIIVTGVCYMPAGTIVVRHDLNVAPGALLDAVTPGDPAGKHPVVPATVRIGGNVFVGKDGVLMLGCSPNISCSNPPGISFDRVGGNITALGALAVVIHSAAIGGSVTMLGGGGGAAGGANSGGCFNTAKYPIPAPWSKDAALSNPKTASPQYTDFEDNFIGGSLTVAGDHTCWQGSLRNLVRGSITIANDVTSDPDGMEIDNNLAGGNLTCLNNDPAVQYGDSAAAPNLVGGWGAGECGFNVLKPNPAPSPGPPPVKAGPLEHISASLGSLNTYSGTHSATFVASLPAVTTESGYTITAVLHDFTLTGTGLTGSGTANPKLLPAPSGDAVLSTVHPNGSASFIAYDTCKCAFSGQSGTVLIRFYGTTSARGFTHGIFLVTSGGVASGHLDTLAGWGTFSNAGQPTGTWRLVEHLRIT
jgi:hypothetical protein